MRFPGGANFAIGVIEERIVVWGGGQRQEDGTHKLLPTDAIHIFDPKTHSWKSQKVSGKKHAFPNMTANIVLGKEMLIFGGHAYSNELAQKFGVREGTKG